MSRAEPGLKAALRALCRALSQERVPYAIIGGIAVLARGVARFTRDIDVTVAGDSVTPEALVAALAPHGFEPRIEQAAAFARAHQVLLLRHRRTGVELDLSFAWAPFELEALRRRERLSFAGVPIEIVQPEDLVVFKLVARRPQDLEDVKRLLLLHGDRVDLKRVRGWVREFAEILEEPERMDEFESLLREVDRLRGP